MDGSTACESNHIRTVGSTPQLIPGLMDSGSAYPTNEYTTRNPSMNTADVIRSAQRYEAHRISDCLPQFIAANLDCIRTDSYGDSGCRYAGLANCDCDSGPLVARRVDATIPIKAMQLLYCHQLTH